MYFSTKSHAWCQSLGFGTGGGGYNIGTEIVRWLTISILGCIVVLDIIIR